MEQKFIREQLYKRYIEPTKKKGEIYRCGDRTAYCEFIKERR